jgi:hypothetical protein
MAVNVIDLHDTVEALWSGTIPAQAELEHQLSKEELAAYRQFEKGYAPAIVVPKELIQPRMGPVVLFWPGRPERPARNGRPARKGRSPRLVGVQMGPDQEVARGKAARRCLEQALQGVPHSLKQEVRRLVGA